MTAERWTDDEGHDWPVTGHWCDVCGLPMHRLLSGVDVHPLCREATP